jgi:CubicO group peptidase (beta-lactamase class C family)
MDLDGFLGATHTTSLVVIVDGAVVAERYFAGVSSSDRLLGNSATKSVLVQLVGLAVDAGKLPDLDQPVVDFVPEIASSGYRKVTVRQLLTMTSGTGWQESLREADSHGSQMIAILRDGRGGLRELLAATPDGAGPDSAYSYNTADTLMLDWVRERATGLDFAAHLQILLDVVGAEQAAIVGLDAPGGVALAGGSLAMCARDWARIGQLQLDGTWRGRRVLSKFWVDRSSTPSLPILMPGRLPSTITTHAGFGYQWWPLDGAGRTLTADGMLGQFVYVDRDRRVVVVKTSAWPYEDVWYDRQCRDLSYLGLPLIAKAADRAVRSKPDLIDTPGATGC